uniref:Strictosidine synthase conserved region domain-containing protein n=1 Tax=Davidia involucrata TaxID=16924 RepID=A0A5B7B878_DAVIN
MSISEYSANLWRFTFLSSVVAPLELVAAVVLYKLDSFDPAPLPTHEFTQQAIPRAALQGLELVGFGQLLAPEDLAYDPKSKLIYTGCADGWIKRVTVNESAADSVVENWINTGGRPLGLALGRNNHEVIVADADKGLLKVNEGGVIKLLTNKSEGVEFRLTDAVDIARDGMIYFTDASYKYSFKEFIRDLLEGKPHGRFMSYNPSTKKTKVLVRDLYFPNGVAVSPDQDFVIFCETPMYVTACMITNFCYTTVFWMD